MFETDVQNIRQRALTGQLPPDAGIDDVMRTAYRRYAEVPDGDVADYIPALAKANPAWFGLALAGVDGSMHTYGDDGVGFTIQSISTANGWVMVWRIGSWG